MLAVILLNFRKIGKRNKNNNVIRDLNNHVDSSILNLYSQNKKLDPDKCVPSSFNETGHSFADKIISDGKCQNLPASKL